MLLDPKSTRREIKYKIFQSDYPRLKLLLFSVLEAVETYPSREINSVYFDTPQYDFALSNISGESRRLKVRGRWYSENDNNCSMISKLAQANSIQCEIKRKVNNLSDKIKTKYDLSPLEKKPSITDLSRYCKNFVRTNGCNFYSSLRETVFISYNRKYYHSNSIKGLRFTLDQNIRYSTTNGNVPCILMSKDYVIFEIKFDPLITHEVTNLLSDFPFRQTRFSKFVSAISKLKRVFY